MDSSTQIKNGWLALGLALALFVASFILYTVNPQFMFVSQFAFILLIAGPILLGMGYYRRSRGP